MIARLVAEALGTDALGAEPVHGGDVASAWRVELADGRRVFAKTKVGAAPEFFAAEAWGLQWLAAADTLAVPEVLHLGETEPLLVLEWIETDRFGSGRAGEAADADFGRALAELHLAGAPSYGRSDGRSTGSRGLPNPELDNWPDFYAQARLLPLAKLAADTAALDRDSIADIETIAGRLAEFGAADEPPARLHGDLWAGNRLVDRAAKNWLIDPAAHGGHREFDLAMMALFGGWGPAAFQAYHRRHPLADGWVDRIPLHQLAPLIVHAIKFGGGYAPATRRALDDCL